MNSTAVAQSINNGMSTVMSHRAFGKHADESLRAVRDEAVRLEELLSRFIHSSEISRINRSAGIRCEKLGSDTYEVLSHAIEFSKHCQGIFDVTIGPLVTLWGSGKDTFKPPENSRIIQVLPLVDYTGLLLDPCKKTGGLRKPGQSIDLGGIGKGFASDKFLEVFKKYGVSSAYTNIGGNVVTLGAKPDGSPWCVGIRHPRQDDCLLGAVAVTDKAVVTSGDYERYFIDQKGRHWHHILNPATGYPAESGLVSVTVVAENAMTADALSTIVFVAGMEKGLGILTKYPETEAVLVDTGMRVWVTKGMKACFKAVSGITVNIL